MSPSSTPSPATPALVAQLVATLRDAATTMPVGVTCPARVLKKATGLLQAALAGRGEAAREARALLEEHVQEGAPEHVMALFRAFFAAHPNATDVVLGVEEEYDDENGHFWTPFVLAVLGTSPTGSPVVPFVAAPELAERFGATLPVVGVMEDLPELGALDEAGVALSADESGMRAATQELTDSLFGQGLGRCLQDGLPDATPMAVLVRVTPAQCTAKDQPAA